MAPATSTPVGPPPTIDDVEHAVVDQVGHGVGRLEQAEQVVAQPDRVLEAVEREGVLGRAGDAEVVGGRAGGDDQVVERAPAARRASRTCWASQSTPDDLGLAEEHPLLAPEQAPHRVADVGRVQAGRRHLVEQRLERVVVVPVDQGDVDGLVLEALGRGQPAEPGSDDHDVRPRSHASIMPAPSDRRRRPPASESADRRGLETGGQAAGRWGTSRCCGRGGRCGRPGSACRSGGRAGRPARRPPAHRGRRTRSGAGRRRGWPAAGGRRPRPGPGGSGSSTARDRRAGRDPTGPARLGLVDVADAAGDPLVEQHVGHARVAGRRTVAMRATHSSTSASGRQRSGPRWPTAGDRSNSTTGAEKHTATQPSTSTSARTRWAGFRQRSPVR